MKKESNQNLISTPTDVFSNGRFVADGYSTHMNFVFDKKDVKSRRLKEWDFYQIQCGNTIVQLVIGHISWIGQLSANLIDLSTGEKHSFSKVFFKTRKLKKKMSVNPEKPNMLQWFSPDVKMQFEVTQRYRRLTFSLFRDKDIRAEVDITLTNASFDKEKAVLAVPFAEEKFWYLNYKENCFAANGYCRLDDKEVFIKDGTAVFDWGRGVWPKKHEWVWGNGSTSVSGVPFGFNIGWGFGNSQTTENMFFYDNKAYKLGQVTQTVDSDGVMHFADEDKNFVFDATPIFDNFTQTHVPFVNNTCHQVFGTWHGTAKLPDGKKIKVPSFVAFCEHAQNQW